VCSSDLDEQLREWGGRLQWDPAVMKVRLPASDDEPIMTWDRHSPGPRPGLAMHRTVTCGCRKKHMLPVLALVYAAIRVAIGVARPGTWVRPVTVPSLELPHRPREPGEDVYSVASDGRLFIDLHERRWSRRAGAGGRQAVSQAAALPVRDPVPAGRPPPRRGIPAT
jgi:hypothetical protein